jgi:antitoxin ParD1/3/4
MEPKTEPMTSMNVSLPESLRKFAEERAAKGFSSVSEYFRALLREDQKRLAQERLEELLLEGLDSGEPAEVTPEYWKKLRARVRERAKKRSAK